MVSSNQFGDARTGATQLVVVDAESGAVRQLTNGAARDENPVWSPDGSRIAFVRRSDSAMRSSVCWTTVDGSRSSCAASSRAAWLDQRIAGWLDQHTVAVVRKFENHMSLVAVSTSAWSDSLLVPQTRWASVSPDGRWIACVCKGANEDSWRLVIFPRDRLASARELRLGIDSPDDARVFWRSAARRESWVARLRIDSAARTVAVGETLLLSARATSAAGTEVPVGVLTWRTSDSTIASVDTLGRVLGRRAGDVIMVASAGGWASDSVRLSVLGDPPSSAVRETWDASWMSRWVPFGQPKPRVVEARDGSRGKHLLVDGDEHYETGVRTSSAWDPRAGFGVEVQFHLSVTRDKWQRIRILVGPHWESASAKSWKGVDGPPPIADHDRAGECGFSYPLYEGKEHRLVGGAHTIDEIKPIQLSASLAAAWHTAKVQLHADGRCSVSLDGHHVWMSKGRLSLGDHSWVTIMGASVATQTLVGPVEIWQGERVEPGKRQ